MRASKSMFGGKSTGFSMHESSSSSANLFGNYAYSMQESVLSQAGTVETVSSAATSRLQEPYYHISYRTKQAQRANSTKQPNHQISDELIQLLNSKQPGASLYYKEGDRVKVEGERYETTSDFLFRDANKSPEERRAIQRIRYPLSPMIYNLLREKERDSKTQAESKPTTIYPIAAAVPQEPEKADAQVDSQNLGGMTIYQLLSLLSASQASVAAPAVPAAPAAPAVPAVPATPVNSSLISKVLESSPLTGDHPFDKHETQLFVGHTALNRAWSSHIYLFEDSGTHPMMNRHLLWREEWCQSNASKQLGDGQAVLIELPETFVDAIAWTRIHFVEKDGRLVKYWCPLYDNRGNVFINEVSSLLEYNVRYTDTIVQGTVAYFNKTVGNTIGGLVARIEELEQRIESLFEPVEAEDVIADE